MGNAAISRRRQVIPDHANVPDLPFSYLQGPRPIGEYREEFDELREKCPVLHSTEGYYVVTRMDPLRKIFTDPATFSNHSASLLDPDPTDPLKPLQIDPPEHEVWRKLLRAEFSIAQANELEPVIRARCNELIDEFEASGSCDFAADFAHRLPIAVYLSLLDLPQSELPRFLAWEDAIVRPSPDDADLEGTLRRVRGEINAYFDELLDRRTAEPGDDMASRVLAWEVDGVTPSREELLKVFFMVFVAGLDTISSELSYSFWHFATHPEDRKRVIAEPEIVPSAIEEMLRYYNIILDSRGVTKDTEVAGCPMKEGDLVLLLSVAANRDPRAFDRPDEVVLDRSPNRHLSFGWGIHRCVGQHLARQQMKVAIEEWHRRIPEYHIPVSAEISEYVLLQLRIESLPLEWAVG